MLNVKRHKKVRKQELKRAREGGYKAGLNNHGLDKNPYVNIGKFSRVYTSAWEAGYSDGQNDKKDWLNSEIK